MVYRTYICDDCGFSSEEEEGVYLCPKCNNKMRIAQIRGTFGGGDSTQTDGKIWIYILFTLFAFPILAGLLNVIGIVIFIVLFYFLRKVLNSGIKNQAIPVSHTEVESLPSADKLYCTNCGQKLRDNDKFCPNCGEKIE